MALLSQAANECYDCHFPGQEPMTVERFKREARENGLWCSSCMVAFENDKLIGVVLAAKRDSATLISRIGVPSTHQRLGHASHMLNSLSQKLAVLGPPKLVAEVPAESQAARAFFESCGYAVERVYTDYQTPAKQGQPAQALEMAIPIGVDDLASLGALDDAAPRCWERTPEALLARKGGLSGLAIAGDEQVEAYILYGEELSAGGFREIAALGCAESENGEALLDILARAYVAGQSAPLRIAKVAPEEIAPERLQSWGFEPGPETIGYSATASDE